MYPLHLQFPYVQSYQISIDIRFLLQEPTRWNTPVLIDHSYFLKSRAIVFFSSKDRNTGQQSSSEAHPEQQVTKISKFTEATKNAKN